MTFLLIAAFFWLGFSFLLGLAAAGFNRSGILFFVISLVVSPVLAGLLLLALGKKDQGDQTVRVRCPECGATTKEGARYCSGCGREFPASQQTAQPQVLEKGAEKAHLSTVGVLLMLAIGFLFALSGAYMGTHLEAVHRAVGLVGGSGIGFLLGYSTKWVFPSQMTTA